MSKFKVGDKIIYNNYRVRRIINIILINRIPSYVLTASNSNSPLILSESYVDTNYKLLYTKLVKPSWF